MDTILTPIIESDIDPDLSDFRNRGPVDVLPPVLLPQDPFIEGADPFVDPADFDPGCPCDARKACSCRGRTDADVDSIIAQADRNNRGRVVEALL